MAATHLHSALDDLSISGDKEANYVLHEDKDRIHGTKTLNPNFDDLDSVSKLQSTHRFADIMQKVEEALENGSDKLNQKIVSEDSPEFRLIADCSALALDIENEIVIVHYFVSEKYSTKFPELASQVIHSSYYARVVKEIGNKMRLTLSELEHLLPRDIASAVSLTAASTRGKPLSEEDLNKTIAACDRLLSLDLAKKKILDYFESRVEFFAPNLSALVGNAVAANLIWIAGGVSSLAKSQGSYVLRQPKVYLGLDTSKPHFLPAPRTTLSSLCPGWFDQTELFQCTPGPLKNPVCKLLTRRSIEAAEVDSLREDPTGQIGRTFREEILKKIVKWKELTLAEQQSKKCARDFSARSERMKIRCPKPTRPRGKRLSYHKYQDILDKRRAREAFEADETMSALGVVFQFGPGFANDFSDCDKWPLMHPHVWYRWFARQYSVM